NGTAAGTVLVKDINTGSNTGSYPSSLTDVNGTLFFAADDGTHGRELWRSDGTAGGTGLVKDIYPTWWDSHRSNLTDVNGTLFFTADDGTHGRELWKSDGTAAGTTLVNDISPGGSTGYYGNYYVNSSTPSYLTAVNGTLFFTADDGTHGRELWKTNGTAAGTTLVKDINTSSNTGSYPRSLTAVNGTLFFTASDGTTGDELWRS